MPYKHAHYWVGFVLLVILVGFWFSYFSILGTGPLAFHVHGLTATTWLLLLLVQHFSIHNRANAFHRQMGKASFVLFPLLMLGFTMIINVSAARFSSGTEPAMQLLGPAFGIGMACAMAAYLTLYYLGLKNRRNVKLHAGYMLATPLILFESPFSRIMSDYLPWMNFIGSEGPRFTIDTIVICNAMAAAFALVLYLKDRKNGLPWLLAIFFTSLQSILMWIAPSASAIGTVFAAYAAIPETIRLIAGFGLGLGAVWLGWRAGAKPLARPNPAAAKVA